MLSSDGLTGVVSDDDIRTVLSKTGAPQTLANELVTRSLAEGAPDNVTVIVARDLETTTAKATKLIGSAVGESPLRDLASNPTSGVDLPRAKSLSLPVHTGGLPITPMQSPTEAEAAAKTRRKRRRIILAIVVTVIVAVLVIVGVALAMWNLTEVQQSLAITTLSGPHGP